MGQGVAQALLGKKSFKIVGAVDIDPELVEFDFFACPLSHFK